MQELSRRRFQSQACIAGARTFLIFFNVIFWIVGLLLLLFGLWMRVSIARAFEISPKLNFALPILLIVTGATMMFISVVACFCSSTDSSVLLYILSAIFFIVFGLILSSSIAGYVYRDYLKTELHKTLNQTLVDYRNDTWSGRDLDRLQHHFECCGVNGPSDWLTTEWQRENPSLAYPDSCCKSLKGCNNKDEEQAWPQGCFTRMVALVNENLSSFGVGTLLISLFQLCGVALTICLANHINKAQYEEMY